ncbi:MAG TPA: bifunctional diaminohydroxyphosphoribosylaminopyrimidine deaminase/5-amino-6-(5-phosphoribosylamino)uracil reductase RibD, partial [Armatimonadota bacterium]|nr:bifunctional diaminohydroxyphosphoribosylaminopyrimidine deaminase/5-amino-6-(5-phosphoribosylamino)uracil reductase RibD [Armatimonadota bacterium]
MNDRDFMKRALRLARRGKTSPNPMVGAVVVREGRIVGEGFHPKAGEPHAEVFALKAAGELAKGADLYVTLEPCCHQGRTPPCTDAVIESGVKRVFAAMQDPNPEVGGTGFEILRQ